MRSAGVIVLCVGAIAGCGSGMAVPGADSQPGAKFPPRHKVVRYHRCNPAGRLITGRLTLCQKRINTEGAGSFRVRGRRLPVERAFGREGDGHFHGSWSWAAASPDRRTILAQWSAECEIPFAYFVRARGGRPRHAYEAGENSQALGWTTDGRAIIYVPAEPGCGGTERDGLYLVTVSGARTKIATFAAHSPAPLERSLRPRSRAEIKQQLG